MKDKIVELIERANLLEANRPDVVSSSNDICFIDLSPISGVDYERWIQDIKYLCKTDLSSYPLREDLLAALKKKDFAEIQGYLQSIKNQDIGSLSTGKQLVACDSKSVFIVHGHDASVKSEAARLCEKIGLSPIILNDQPSKGNTVIEKIEEYSNVGFALVLYTPCDIGKENNDSATNQRRARQNVVFEHGYLVAKLGRNKVCALVMDNVETPSDISGLVYISIDSEGMWKYKVIDELKAAGFIVSKDNI